MVEFRFSKNNNLVLKTPTKCSTIPKRMMYALLNLNYSNTLIADLLTILEYNTVLFRMNEIYKIECKEKQEMVLKELNDCCIIYKLTKGAKK